MSEHVIEGFRLSPQQRRLWRLQQLDGVHPYVAQSALLIEGRLEPDLLRVALEQVIDRHEILRTTFHPLPEMELPLQVISEGRVSWRQEQRAMEGSPDEHRAELEAILEEARQAAFDLKNGALIRASLFTLGAQRHLFIVTLPSLLADLATLTQLSLETLDAYAALLSGEQPYAQAIQYADLSEWQNELLETEEASPGKEFWHRQELPQTRYLKLPYAHRNGKECVEAGRLTTAIPAARVAELKELARTHALSIETLLHSCWQILLWRLTGEELIVTSALFDGRHYAETKNVLGACARYLPVRTRLHDTLSFARVAAALEESLKEVSEWQEYFIEEVEPGLPGEAGDGLRIGFEHMQWPTARRVADLSVSFCELYSRFDRHDLKLSCVQRDETILLEFSYDASLFERSAIERLAGNLQALVKSALAEPHVSISRLEILSDAERQQLLREFNEAEQEETTHELCIHEVFERQAEMSPDTTAVVFQHERLSYGELNERADALAQRLRALGVGPETLVGICVERSLEMVVGILAILKAGGAYVPLDPSYPKERLSFMLEDTRVPVLLTQRRLLAELPACPARKICLDQETTDELNTSTLTPRRPSPDHPVYVIYTSGSTGRPKGVVVTHRNLWHSTAARLAFYNEPPARFLLTSSFAFDSSVAGLFWTLCSGGTLCLPSEGIQRDVPRLAALIVEHSITHLLTLPSVYALLLEHARAELVGLPSTLIVAGEACPRELIKQHSEISPGASLFNEYGPTESTVWSTVYDCRTHDGLSPVPIGRTIRNTQLFLLDARQELVPPGFPGELYIGGGGLARGYHNSPELTAERFIPNPFATRAGERLYRTGDLARYLPDGQLEFLGRNDEQVKVRGFRIELREIESVLERHEQVQQAVVLAREDEPGAKRLVAYVLPAPTHALSNDALRQFIKERLPDYMIPAIFVMVDGFPLTPNGKVDRKALEPPEAFRRASSEEYRAPRNRTEEVLAGIWSEILGVERVGMDDNFFALGGDSIRGIQAIARANRAGIQLTPQQLFQHQTIALLATVAGSAPVVQSEQGVAKGTLPLTPIQRWFFELDAPEPHHFNQSVLLEVRQSLDLALLEQAVGLLLKQHDALRLRFERLPERGWQQSYASADEPAPVSQLTLPSRTEEEYRAAIESAVARLQATLDLTAGPIARFTLFRSAEGLSDRLHIAVHHLAVDGVSWPILLEDLELAYEQLARGQAPSLPRKTTSYQYWAERLSNYAQSEALKQEAAYWLSQTGTSPGRLPLDFEKDARSNTVASTETVTRSLDEQQTKALLIAVPRLQRVQVDDILLTALARSLARWTHHDSHLICLESHGRHELFADVDLSRTVGWFTAHYPVRLTLPTGADVGAELKTIKEQLRRVPNHGTGYGLLRYQSGAEQASALARLPQAELLFNYFGNLDQVLQASSLFRLCRDSVEHDRSLKTVRDFPLEVNAYVLDGRLTTEWAHSSQLHRRETIEALADAFQTSLRVLIDYCRTAESAAYTPSDFPKATLNQTELDHLLAKLAAARGGQA